MDPDDTPTPPATEVTVQVRNDNLYDATIYAVYGDTRERLGHVPGLSTETLHFTWKTNRMHFVIRLLAITGDYPTESLTVNPGDELELHVRPDLHQHTPQRPATPGP